MNNGEVRDVRITGTGCAGPWGVTETPPSRVRGVVAHESALEVTPPGLSPRQRRYLGRNSRLAIAACDVALRSAAYPEDPRHREPLACWVATPRGPTDFETTLEMIRDAVRAGSKGRPLARAALDTYNRRRVQVQYLLSMETAVAGQVTAAFGIRGPTHVVTTPGAAGGALALARAIRSVERGRSPAALVCGVTTGEDPASTRALGLAAREPSPPVEGAAAMLIEPADAVSGRAGSPGRVIRVRRESFEDPFAGDGGAAASLWKVARHCLDREASVVEVRGFAGHRLSVELRPAGGVR